MKLLFMKDALNGSYLRCFIFYNIATVTISFILTLSFLRIVTSYSYDCRVTVESCLVIITLICLRAQLADALQSEIVEVLSP